MTRKNLLIRAIHCSKLWTEFYRDNRTDYEEKLYKFYKVRSSKEMSIEQLSDFLDYMNGKKKSPCLMIPRIGSRSAGPDAIRSRKQMYLIGKLRSLVKWNYEDGFERWCLKKFGFSEPKTDDQCFRAIEGLKAMFEGQMRDIGGVEWHTKEWENPDVRFYILRYFTAKQNKQKGKRK